MAIRARLLGQSPEVWSPGVPARRRHGNLSVLESLGFGLVNAYKLLVRPQRHDMPGSSEISVS